MSGGGEQLLVVLDPETGTALRRCDGPDVSGLCPAVAAGEPVPCGGLEIASGRGNPATRWRMHVPCGSEACPIGWHDPED